MSKPIIVAADVSKGYGEKTIIPKIRPHTRYEETGLFTVIKALYQRV